MFYKFKDNPPIWRRDKDVFLFRHKPTKMEVDSVGNIIYSYILEGEPTGKIIYSDRIDDIKPEPPYELFDTYMGSEMQYISAKPDDWYVSTREFTKSILEKKENGTLEEFWYKHDDRPFKIKNKDGIYLKRKSIILLNTEPNGHGKISGCIMMHPISEYNEDTRVEIDTTTYTNWFCDDGDWHHHTVDIANTTQLYCYEDDLYNHLNAIYNFKGE